MDLDVLTKIFATWAISECMSQEVDQAQIKDLDEKLKNDQIDGIISILYHRMLNVGKCLGMEDDKPAISLSPFGYIMIDMQAGGNPGIALIMLHKMLKDKYNRIGYLQKGARIDADDFAASFNRFYNCEANNADLQEWLKKWDEQKTPKGDNMVDTVPYWTELFEPGDSSSDHDKEGVV